MSTPLAALGDTPNAHQALPTLLTGGQPSGPQFRALREAGVELIVDLRDPMEQRGCDQGGLMEELGFDYRVVAVTPMSMTDDTIDTILAILREQPERPTLVHCASGNRVGGALFPYLVLDHGFTEDDAMTAAMQMGLRSAEVLQWGQEYLARHR